MPTSYTSLLGLALPVTGELSGTWGDTVNNYITSYVDASVAGAQTISGSQTAVTLSTTNGTSLSQAGSGATGSAQYQIINCTGNPAGLLTITAPATSKSYIVINATSTSQSVKIVGTGPTTGVTVISGEKAVVAWNGSDFVKVASSVLTALTGTLSVGNGGTGLTSGTSGGVPYYSATNTLASSAALTANQFIVGGGAGAAPASSSLLTISAAVTTGNYVKAVGYADTVTALGNTGTAINIDVTSGGVFTATLTGNCTFTLRYPVSSGASSFTLILTNDATPSRTVAWAGGSFKFPGGAASLSRSTAASAVDIWVFFTPDGGTTWYGNIAMKNMTA